MAQTNQTQRELECIEKIINEALKSSEGNAPTITDILHSYDNYIAQNKISPTSLLGQNVYKSLLRVSRKKGDNWFAKLSNDSQLKPKETSNVFHKNLLNENSFSFAQPYRISLSTGKKSSQKNLWDSAGYNEINEIETPREDLDDPLTLEKLGKTSTKRQALKELDLRKDLGNLYNNPHLKGEKLLKPSEEMNIGDYFSYRYRHQSPPVRESETIKEMKRTSTQKDLNDSKRRIVTDRYPGPNRRNLEMENYIRTATVTDRDSKAALVSTQLGDDEYDEGSKQKHAYSSKGFNSINSFQKYLDSVDLGQLKSQRAEEKIVYLRTKYITMEIRKLFVSWKKTSLERKSRKLQKAHAIYQYNKNLALRHFICWV